MTKPVSSIGAANVATVDLRKQFIEDAKINKTADDNKQRSTQHGAYVLMLLAAKGDFRDRENKLLQLSALLAGAKPSADIPSARVVAVAMFNPTLPSDKTKWTPAHVDAARLFEVNVKFTATCVDLAQRLLSRQTTAAHFDVKLNAFAPMLSAFPRKGERINEKDLELGTRIPLSGASVSFKNADGAKFERRINLAEFLRATSVSKGTKKPDAAIVINKKIVDGLSSMIMNDKERVAFMKSAENADAMHGLLANIAEYMAAELTSAIAARDELNRKIVADIARKGKARPGKATATLDKVA